MDRIKQSLIKEGRFESCGKFTLDGQFALQRLKNSLLQPENCLLYVLQSAVASGASWMEVKSSLGEVKVSHDGFFPRVDEAADLLNWALGGGRKREQVPRHRLGMALASCLAEPGAGMTLDFPSGEIHSIRNSPKGVRTSVSSGQPSPWGELRIPILQTWWRKWIGTASCKALERLRQRGKFAPLLLTVDDKPVSGVAFGAKRGALVHGDDDDPNPFEPEHHVFELRFPSQEQDSQWLALPSKTLASIFQSSQPWKLDVEMDGPHSTLAVSGCAAAIAVLLTAPKRGAGPVRIGKIFREVDSYQHSVEVVQHGVTLNSLRESLTSEYPTRLIVANDEVETDASFLNPVKRSGRLRDIVRPLRTKFEKCITPYWQEFKGSKSEDSFAVWLAKSIES